MIRSLLCLLLLLASLPVRAAEDIVEVVSPGGITAWLVEDHSIPMVALEFHVRGGAALDPDETLGATTLMVGLLDEGTETRDAIAFTQAREELAAIFYFGASLDGVSVSARMLTENLDASVDLLAEALLTPAFSDEAMMRVKAQVIAGLKAEDGSPNAVAYRRFSDLMFAGHPYSRNAEGTVETVEALTREDLVTAHSRAFVRDRLSVAVVGDITPDALGPLLDKLLGNLPAEGPDLPPPAEIADDGGTTVIDFPSQQAIAVLGSAGIDTTDPDYFAAMVLNHILGGGSEARLNQEVREKRGLSYGVSSSLADFDHADLFLISLSSANETIVQALDVIRDELTLVAETGIGESELERAKRYLTGAYPLQFDGNGRIAGILVGQQVAGLPITYSTTRNERVEVVTLEDISRVAERLIRPDALRTVIVGQPEGLEPTE